MSEKAREQRERLKSKKSTGKTCSTKPPRTPASPGPVTGGLHPLTPPAPPAPCAKTPPRSGASTLMSGVMAGRTIDLDGREIAYDRIFKLGTNYYCEDHAPAKAGELGPREVESLMREWKNCDLAAQAKKSNFTNFPVMPVECITCYNRTSRSAPLWTENRKVFIS
jgi:hypothetical protein